jgi:hypothetical protein
VASGNSSPHGPSISGPGSSAASRRRQASDRPPRRVATRCWSGAPAIFRQRSPA